MITMKFKTLIVSTVLCALIENSLSYAIIDDDQSDDSDDFEIELIDLDNDKNNHVDKALTDKYRYDHDSNNDHPDNDLYFEEAHRDNDKDYYDNRYHDYHRHFYNARYDRCDDHNQLDDDHYNVGGRDENDIPDLYVRSGFDYKKRSVSRARQPRSNHGREPRLKPVRRIGGQPPSRHDGVGQISRSRLTPIKYTNKRRVLYFRGRQPISGPILRPGQQIKEKRAMKKL